MEVTPEMYAWFTSLNIINPFLSLEEDSMNSFMIPEKIVNLLLGGKYMDIILKHLQDAYNKYYKAKMDFTSKMKEIKEIEEDQDYISNSVKYSNWHIIGETLKKFGINYTEEEIMKVVNGDKEFLLKILTQIYEQLNQYLKQANNKSNKNNKNEKQQNNNFKRMFTQPKEKEGKNFDKMSKNSNFNLADLNDTKSMNEMNNSTMKKISQDHTLNINNLDENKSYEDCLSALEFFIISLSKNLDMKPRQSVALLSNNRKYLSIICNKGINGSFRMIKNWLNDLVANSETMLKLIKSSEDGLNIGYGTIGTAICSKDKDIPLQAIQLLNKIFIGTGTMNWDWLKKEGIDSIMFTISKHENNKVEIMNFLYEFVRLDIKQFFNILNNKSCTNDKNKVLEFLANILPISKQLNSIFIKQIQELLYDICLNERDDMSYSTSILADAFYYFYPIDESTANKTISYFKNCIKSNSLNIFSTAVAQTFNLMNRFGQIKNKYAPPLYKNIVLLFLEFYDGIYKREFFLENFEKFFNSQQQIPIDILLDPYLKQLNSVQNYNSSDLIFIFKMVEHPRIESHDITEIIQFLLGVCLNNVIYSRTANLILSLIFEKSIIQKLCTPSDSNEIGLKFVDFINNALELFMSSITNLEDKAILEMPYDIINEDFPSVNEQVHNQIIYCIKEYRKKKSVNCNGLLAMLWNFPDHDEIVLQMEEENRPIYEPVQILMKKKIKENEEKERKDFQKKTQNYINQIQQKRNSVVESKEFKNAQRKLKEDKIKKNLAERRRIVSVMSGIEPVRKPPVLTENLLISTTSSKTSKFKNFNQNNIETGGGKSNMLQAINNASQKFNEKRQIYEQNSRTEVNREEYIFKNNYVNSINRFKENRRDDILEKYGNIMSVERQKKMEEEQNKNKAIEKWESSNMLIQPEGKYIKIYPGGKQIYVENLQKARRSYKSFDVNKNYGLPLDLEEEESRELKAINGYNFEYKKNIRYYFKSYANEITQTITKAKLIRMFRDKGISKARLDLEEVNDIIRNLFNDNLVDFDFNQFCNLLVQISFLIYSKRRPSLTIGETYGILLRRFKLANETESAIQTRKKMEPVIDLLLEKKENNQPYNLPEGFKFVKKTYVKYNSRLAPHFQEILGESKFICYQVLEDIIFHIFNSSIIEPYVEISIDDDIELEPEKIHKWTPGMHMAYIEMDKKYNKIGIEVADVLEEGFKKIIKGKNSKGEKILHPYDIKLIEEERRILRKENKQMMFFADRRKEIKEKIEKYREKKREEYRKRKRQLRKMRKKRKEEISKVRKKFEEVMERRKKKEEERKNKMESMKEEKIKKENEKNEKIKEILKGERKKLDAQNKELFLKKDLIIRLKEQEKKKLEDPQPKSAKPDYFQKDKEYIKFEHELNNTINNLLEREDIKKVYDDYKEHLKLIYNIYSKIDCNKISFYLTEGGIKEESFKQFLINFTVLGLLVSSDQMTYIYNVITRASQKQNGNISYLDYHDFEMAICYLAIFSRFADRARKILPSDIDNTNGETIEYFIKFLGLELPFEKYELEQYINDRRSMTVKNLLNLQRELRNNDVNFFKKMEMEKEEKKKKELKKKIMEIEKKKNEQLRIEEEKKIEEASKRKNNSIQSAKSKSRSKSKSRNKSKNSDKKSNKSKDKKSNKSKKEDTVSLNKESVNSKKSNK